MLAWLFFAAVPVMAGERTATPPAADAAQRLEQLNAEIEARRAALNHFVWSCYLIHAEQARITPPIMDSKGMDFSAIRDTVPGIDRLQRDYLAADSVYTDILRTDSAYASIREEYIRLHDLDPADPKRRSNRERYNLMYDRLRKDNPDYIPAWKARNEAIRLRNMALTRLLLDYYKAQGRPMPDETIRSQRRRLREEWPDIVRQESELDVLERLRGQLFEAQQRERFGLSAAEGTKEVVYW